MAKEIGGYFELGPLRQTGEYYPNAVALNTARNALVYLVRAINIKKLYLPRFLCDSVSGVCIREGVPYEEYAIGADWLPKEFPPIEDGSWLYFVNYYDQLSDEQILSVKKQYPNLILDHVQAFFHRPPEGIDTIYSCRKYFGVPDGAYLITDAVLNEPLITDISMDRMRHLLGRLEGKSASDYYTDFQRNDAAFDALELRAMSKLTHTLLGAIDYDAAKAQREENFSFLAECLGERNPLNVKMPCGPYAYPFYCENGMELKKRLAKEGLFIPTLWPNVCNPKDTMESRFAMNILPLPCDQRYDKSAIIRIVAAVLDQEFESLDYAYYID